MEDLSQVQKLAISEAHDYIKKMNEEGKLPAESILALCEIMWVNILGTVPMENGDFFWAVVDSMMNNVEDLIKKREQKTLE